MLAVTDKRQTMRDRIVDAAIELAEQGHWESVRLHELAAREDITLNDINNLFREKEDIIEAWFDRADQTMLKASTGHGFAGRTDRGKLHLLMMEWFGALADHRRVTRQMILGKLEPGHVHYQVKGLLRVSRTVQWWREAAGRSAVLPWRAVEESVLTSLYLASFGYWMWDDSENSHATSRFLERGLKNLSGMLGCGSGPAYSENRPVQTPGAAGTSTGTRIYQ